MILPTFSISAPNKVGKYLNPKVNDEPIRFPENNNDLVDSFNDYFQSMKYSTIQ